MAIFLSFKRRIFRLWICFFVKTGVFRIYYTDKSGACQSVLLHFSAGFSKTGLAIKRKFVIQKILQGILTGNLKKRRKYS